MPDDKKPDDKKPRNPIDMIAELATEARGLAETSRADKLDCAAMGRFFDTVAELLELQVAAHAPAPSSAPSSPAPAAP